MRRTLRRINYKEIGLTVLFSIGIVWALSLVWGIASKEERAREGVSKTRSQFAALAEREATLERDIAALKTTRGKEAVLRDSLGVARPGEEVIIVVPAEEPPPPPPQKSWWSWLTGWF